MGGEAEPGPMEVGDEMFRGYRRDMEAPKLKVGSGDEDWNECGAWA